MGRKGQDAALRGSVSTRTVEDRRAARTKGRLLVRFGTSVADRTGFTKNISETGLFIHTNQVYRPGTTLQVTLQFPERSFSFWARVAWAKKVPPQLAHLLECGMGIRIVDPPPDWGPFYTQWKKKHGSPAPAQPDQPKS